MIFELRQYDKSLMTFDYENLPLAGESVKIISINEGVKHLLPNSEKLYYRTTKIEIS